MLSGAPICAGVGLSGVRLILRTSEKAKNSRSSQNSASPHFVNKEGKDPKVALVYQGEPVAVAVAVPGVGAAWARGLPPGLVLGTRSWSIPHFSSERSVE